MARRYYSSTAVATTLSANANNSTTSITVAALSGFPVSTPWTAIIDADTVNEEVVEVTNVAGTTLTVTRGVDGTTAVAHNAGAVFRHGVSARDFDEANDHVNTTGNPHGTTSSDVGAVANTLVDAKGDIITATADNTPARLAVGSNGQVLKANSATSTGLEWATDEGIPASTVDAKGDLLVGTADNTVGRLAAGSNGQVLQADSSASTGLKWAAPAGPIVSHYFTDGQGSVTVTVPAGKYLVTTDATDTVVTVGSNSRTGSGVLNVTSTGSSFGVSRPQIPASPIEPTTWTTRTSGFGSTRINSVAFGNNVYVAAGHSGVLTTSTDAISWTTRTSGFSIQKIYGVAYGNGTYVAGGYNGNLTTSTNAITWTTRSSGGSATIHGITFANNQFVFVGTGGVIRTSTDGTSWANQSSPTGTGLRSVTYGNGTYVAVGLSGTLISSTNGTSWQTRTSGFGSVNIWVTAFGNGVFLAGGSSGTLTTSTDGITWTTRTSGFGGGTIYAITHGAGGYVVGGGDGAGGLITTSTNATTWTSRTSNFGTNNVIALTASSDVYVAGGYSGRMATAPASTVPAQDQPTGVVVHALTNVT